LLFALRPGEAGNLGAPSPPPAGPLRGAPAQPGPQLRLLGGDRRRRQAHRGTVDAHDPASPAFGHPEPVAQRRHGAALAVRGQKFPAEISLSMSMSRAWLATNFLSRAFSASSSLSRLASLDFIPPYWASQRCHVDSAISRWRHTSASSWPAPRSLLPSASLRMI